MKVDINTYLTAAVNSLQMEIIEMGAAKLDYRWKAENVCSDYTRIYYILEGTGELIFGDNHVALEPGYIYIIPAGVTFSYACYGYLNKTFFHVVTPPGHQHDLFYKKTPFLRLKDVSGYSQCTEQCMSAQDITLQNVLRIKQCLHDTILRAFMELPESEQEYPVISDTVLHGMIYIATNLQASLTVPEISEKLFISPSKLQKAFRKELGQSVGQYINTLALECAAKELLNSDRTIKEISEHMGFCDQFYFSRCFTKKYHVSPAEYRRQYLYS